MDLEPPPIPTMPAPIIPPPEPRPQIPSQVGVGSAVAPGGQAPVWNVTNSVINVGQQRVTTQGPNPQPGASPLAATPP